MVAGDTKTCRKCGATLPISEFYGHPKTADRHLNFCRTCVKARTSEYRRRRRRGETIPRVFGRRASRRKYTGPSWEQRLAKRGIIVKKLNFLVPAGTPDSPYQRLVRIATATCQTHKSILCRALELYLDFLEKRIAEKPPQGSANK